MKILMRLVWALLVVSSPILFSNDAWGSDRTFVGKVSLVEVRAAWGDYFIMQVVDGAGTALRLCDSNTYPNAMALQFTDPSAKAVMAIALSAKLNNLTVVGWGLDASSTGGLACGIGNLALQ